MPATGPRRAGERLPQREGAAVGQLWRSSSGRLPGRLAGCRNMCRRPGAGAFARGVELGAPLDLLRDGAQEPVLQWLHVGVGGAGPLPGDRGWRTGFGRDGGDLVVPVADAEEGTYPRTGVGAVVGEGLAGPVAGDQDAAAADAEGGFLVDAALAVAGPQLGVCLLRLDAVEEPVGAPVRAGCDAQLLPEPVEVVPLGLRADGVAVGGVLGEVLGDVADS